MTKYGSELLPEDFFVADGRAIAANYELIEARDIAEKHPYRWVRVGHTRRLSKEPSAWCSEVNNPRPGKEKRVLLERGGVFRACHWQENPGDGDQPPEYGKAIMFIPDEV